MGSLKDVDEYACTKIIGLNVFNNFLMVRGTIRVCVCVLGGWRAQWGIVGRSLKLRSWIFQHQTVI
jgi:hypothetical protein